MTHDVAFARDKLFVDVSSVIFSSAGIPLPVSHGVIVVSTEPFTWGTHPKELKWPMA